MLHGGQAHNLYIPPHCWFAFLKSNTLIHCPQMPRVTVVLHRNASLMNNRRATHTEHVAFPVTLPGQASVCAELCCQGPHLQHITPTLIHLHWLPVKSRITYRILLLTYKSLHSLAPQYLSDLLHPYTQSWTLHSSGTNQLSIPHTKLQTLGIRAFCATAPTLWNTLSAEIYKKTSLETFKADLKNIFLIRSTSSRSSPINQLSVSISCCIFFVCLFLFIHLFFI